MGSSADADVGAAGLLVLQPARAATPNDAVASVAPSLRVNDADMYFFLSFRVGVLGRLVGPVRPFSGAPQRLDG